MPAALLPHTRIDSLGHPKVALADSKRDNRPKGIDVEQYQYCGDRNRIESRNADRKLHSHV